jgi:hypothetical protein
MKCPPSFHNATDFWQPREKSNHDWTGQALCVVGYDDEQYGGAFEVLNSWGSEWGNKGYTWIRYNDFVDFTKYAFEIIMLDNTKQHLSLSGEVALKLDDLTPMSLEAAPNGILKTSGSYQTGTNFRIYVNNENPGFVYSFGTDSSNELFPIFPVSENLSPAYTYRNSTMAIPGEDSYIALSGSAGKDYLCIMYSKKALDMDQIFMKLKKRQGSMLDNIYRQLGAYIPRPGDVQCSGTGIRFHAKDPSLKTVMLVIEIDHVNQHW